MCNYLIVHEKGRIRKIKLPKKKPIPQPFKVFIYILFDIKLNRPIYVGATQNPQIRLINHRSSTLKNYQNRYHVSLEILEETTSEFAAFKEEEGYLKLKSLGYELLQSGKKWYATGMVGWHQMNRSYQRHLFL